MPSSSLYLRLQHENVVITISLFVADLGRQVNFVKVQQICARKSFKCAIPFMNFPEKIYFNRRV